MIHILGKKQKRKKNLLSLLCHNLIPDHFPCPFLVSTHHVTAVGHTQPLGWWPEDEGSGHSSFSQSLTFSHCSLPLLLPYLFLLFQQSLPWSLWERPAPAWAHQCSTDLSCSGCGCCAFLLCTWCPFPGSSHRGAPRVAEGLSWALGWLGSGCWAQGSPSVCSQSPSQSLPQQNLGRGTKYNC